MKTSHKKTPLNTWIPNTWEVTPLDKAAQVQTGISKSSSRSLTTPISVPYLRVANVQDGHLDLDTIKEIEVESSQLERYRLKKGDVLMTEGGDFDKLGRGCVWDGQIDPCIHQNHVFVVRPDKEKLIPEFLSLVSSSYYGRKYFSLSSKQSTNLASINSTQLKSFPLPLPVLSEQKKIVTVVAQWDKAITQTQQMIEAKQKLKRGLMQQLLTGKARFPEFGKPSKNGELPDGWKQIKLKECFKERKESAPDLPLLSITSSRGVIYRDDVERKDTSNEDKSKYKKIVPGDIGYNTMRMWQGVSAVSELEGIVSPAYTVCQPRKNIHSTYFGYLFKYAPMVNMFHRHSQGLVSDTLNLKFPLFSKIPVVIPSFDEQVKIAQCLSEIDKEIEQLEQKIVSLEHQKQGLMQKLLTGQIRVPVKEN